MRALHSVRTWACGLGILAFGSGCGSLLEITVTERAETVVPGASILEVLAGDLGFEGLTTMDLTASEEMRNQGVEPGDIRDTRLQVFELEVLDPTTQDLTFLEEMSLYVEAPGLARVLVASQVGFPVGETAVEFTVEDVDLTDYAVSEAMTLSTEVTGHRPDQDTTVQATVTFEVGVTTQGVRNQI